MLAPSCLAFVERAVIDRERTDEGTPEQVCLLRRRVKSVPMARRKRHSLSVDVHGSFESVTGALSPPAKAPEPLEHGQAKEAWRANRSCITADDRLHDSQSFHKPSGVYIFVYAAHREQ